MWRRYRGPDHSDLQSSPQTGPSLGRGLPTALGIGTPEPDKGHSEGPRQDLDPGPWVAAKEEAGLSQDGWGWRQSDSYHEAGWVSIHVFWLRPVGSYEKGQRSGCRRPHP